MFAKNWMMLDDLHISDFLNPIDLHRISNDAGYKEGQIGKVISAYTEETMPELEIADIILVGCGEQRGAGIPVESTAADAIRSEFYNLYHWHSDVRLADIGNIKIGKSLNDTYAALKIVLHELTELGKMVVVLGGSNDLTVAQYYAYADYKRLINAAGIDAIIDINIDSPLRSDSFLMDILTAEPNYMSHYNHLAFQSYFIHPRMLETMDKLRFDCHGFCHPLSTRACG